MYLHIEKVCDTMKKKFSLIFFLIAFTMTYASEMYEYARFGHYMTKDGLSSNLVFSLTKDSTGFLWIGTDFGLDRFDGVYFKHYRKNEYPSLYREDIYYVSHLGNNQVVLGGFSGMFQAYDRKKDVFVDLMPSEMDSLGYSQMKGVFVSPSGDRYVFSNERVFKYDETSDSFNSHFSAYDSLLSPFISALYVDTYHRYWIGSINNLTVYDEMGNTLFNFDKEHDQCRPVTNIMAIDKERIAVTFMGNELWIFQTSDLTKKKVITTPFNSVSKMIKGQNGYYWFGTDGDGLWYSESLNEETSFKSMIPYNGTADDIKKIYGLVEGNDGTIWIGTQNSGLWSYNPSEDSSIMFSGNFGFPSNMCTSFAEDQKGNLLVGTDGNGLFSISPDFRTIRQYELACNNVTGISVSHNETLVSTWGGGILSLNLQNGRASEISYDTIAHPTNIFFYVNKATDGTIWGSSANDDLYMKEPSGMWKKIVLQDDSIRDLNSKWIVRTYQGKDNRVWVLATNMLWLYDGVHLCSIRPEMFSEKSHSPYFILDADVDKEGNLLASTNRGIFRYSYDGTRLDTLSFIPDDTYRIIKCDNQNRCWLASYTAILSVDMKKESYSYLPGIYHDLFYVKSGFEDSKGRICFGTSDGFYIFNPSQVRPDRAVQYLSFSELYVSRKKVQPGTSVLKNGALSDLKEIELKYGMTDIDIEVDVLDYAKYNKAQLRYRMKGLQDEWLPLKDVRKLSFNYIPSGTYTLEVEAYRPNMEYQFPYITLGIRVLPPWWNTWWFRMIILFAIFFVLSIYFRKKILRLKAEKVRLKHEVEKQGEMLTKTREDREKLISVLSHDLKNPLFAVVGNDYDEINDVTRDEIVEMVVDKSVLEENTVLIVDKDEKTQTEIKDMLSDYFHVIVASTGEDAVVLADSQLPDIIVSDMDLLELSVAEMSKQLSASERTRHIPILFVSSKNEEVDRLLGLLCGAIDYVAKPFNQLELLLKLTNILKVRQEHQKLILQASISQRVKEQTMMNTEDDTNTIHPFLQSFMDVVSECYKDNMITVDELAAKLTVSKATLTRKVKSMTGKTPMEWLMEYRLNRSLQILQNTNSGKTISEIAYEVGFSDPSYFTKKFRDFYGCLPSQIDEKKSEEENTIEKD